MTHGRQASWLSSTSFTHANASAGVYARVPTVVCIHLERPAVIPETAKQSAALLGDFGAGDAAVLDVVYGRFKPLGRLPYELPSSMDAVYRQYPTCPMTRRIRCSHLVSG